MKEDLIKRSIVLNIIKTQLAHEEMKLKQATRDFAKRIISTRIALLRDLEDYVNAIERVK